MGMRMNMDWKGKTQKFYLFARHEGRDRKTEEEGKEVWKIPIRVHMSFDRKTEVLDMVSDEVFTCENDASITYPNIYEYLMGLDTYKNAVSVFEEET